MNKKILSISAIFVALVIIVCACNKNKENPLPAILFTNSASLTFNSVEQTKLIATSTSDKNKYVQNGTSTTGVSFSITFLNRPSKDTTVDLSNSGLNVTLTAIEIIQGGGTKAWNASTGIINVTVQNGITSSAFNSVPFTNLSKETALGTGSITTKN